MPDHRPQPKHPSTLEFMRVWFVIGFQSFGGGMATLALVRRACVEQHRWMTEEEFTRAWGLSQTAPGINLICVTILIGRRLLGIPGIALALVGMLAPSVAMTILITAFFARANRNPIVQGALHGIMPATIGLGLLTMAQMLRPLVRVARQGGWSEVLLVAALLAASAVAVGTLHLPVIAVLVGCAAAGGLTSWMRHAVSVDAEAGEP